MSVFTHPAFDQHEQVAFCCDPTSGLNAIIAIHNSSRGPALGGCRMWPYPSDDQALTDVLRLARGMTYKSAMAGLDLGGGKSVIIGDPHQPKSDALLAAFGRYLNALGGRYIAAEDVGTSVDDMMRLASYSAYVAGLADQPGNAAGRSGDPSPATAYGVLVGIEAAVRERLERDDLSGVKVALQGLGHVGYRLAQHLRQAGAQLWVTDIDRGPVRRATAELGVREVAADQIYDLDVDVFAPCALGAVINDATVARLHAKVVAGAANNQLAAPRHGAALAARGILYAPDYVINAGGIIDIAQQRQGFDRERWQRRLDGIGDTLREIFARARAERLPTNQIADRIAEERFRR